MEIMNSEKKARILKQLLLMEYLRAWIFQLNHLVKGERRQSLVPTKCEGYLETFLHKAGNLEAIPHW